MLEEFELAERMIEKTIGLPELLGKADEHTLIVIGNGFDMAHGIPSSYTNFREWLVKNGHEYLANSINSYFPDIEDVNYAVGKKQDIRWGDVEDGMGFYDEKAILEECRPREEIDYDHTIQSTARVTDSVEAFFKPQLDEFRELFEEWVNSLDIKEVSPFLQVPNNAKYLSFNYTETLEQCYGIDPDKVLHIHGSRLPHGGKYVFGHFKKKTPNDVYGDEESLTFEMEAHENVVTWMNEWYKPTEDYIWEHRDLFWHLGDINKVIFIGKTINKVDEDYFDVIQKHIPNGAQVYMTYHYDSEPFKIASYILNEGLPFEKWKLSKW